MLQVRERYRLLSFSRLLIYEDHKLSRSFFFYEKAIPRTEETKELLDKATNTVLYSKYGIVFRRSLETGKVEIIGSIIEARLKGVY